MDSDPATSTSSLSDAVSHALTQGGLADITTIGRRSGQQRRIEIVFHHFDGVFFLTGRPVGKRDWEANIAAHPEFVLHLKGETTADVAVVGELVAEPDEREHLIRRALIESWGTAPEKADAILAEWVAKAPLVRFSLV